MSLSSKEKEVPLHFDQNHFIFSSSEQKDSEKTLLMQQTLGTITPLETPALTKELPPSLEPTTSLKEAPSPASSSGGTLMKPAIQGLCEGTADGIKNLAGDLKDLLSVAKNGVLVIGKAAFGDPESQEKVKEVAEAVVEVSGKVLEVLAVLTPPSEELRRAHPEIAAELDKSREQVIKQLKAKATEFGETGKQWGEMFLKAHPEDQARMISKGFGEVLSNLMPVGAIGRLKHVTQGAKALEGIETVNGAIKVEKISKVVSLEGLFGTNLQVIKRESAEVINQGLKYKSWKGGATVIDFKSDKPRRYYQLVNSTEEAPKSPWVMHENPMEPPPGITREEG